MTADTDTKIIPFGKYKGRLVEEVLLDDPAYLQWLAGQDWFRAKFNILHQVIINRGAEPEETPDHNAMQVKFLDDEFCLRFMRYLKPEIENKARRTLNDESRLIALKGTEREIKETESSLKHYESYIAEIKKRIEQQRMDSYWRGSFDEYQQKVGETGVTLAQLRADRENLLKEVGEIKFRFSRKFEERGVDIVLTCDIKSKIHQNILPYWFEAKIEIKPVIGDDYPAVLRQIKANGSDVLFKGATQEQFVKTMATAGIRVVFAHDVGEEG
jgi:uncharacterized protein (DUF3820 family)